MIIYHDEMDFFIIRRQPPQKSLDLVTFLQFCKHKYELANPLVRVTSKDRTVSVASVLSVDFLMVDGSVFLSIHTSFINLSHNRQGAHFTSKGSEEKPQSCL